MEKGGGGGMFGWFRGQGRTEQGRTVCMGGRGAAGEADGEMLVVCLSASCMYDIHTIYRELL